MKTPNPSTNSPVWWDEYDNQWRTRFAAPPGFDGDEDGDLEYGDYSRTLTPEEEAAMEGHNAAARDRLHAAGAPERDAWFAALTPDGAPLDVAPPDVAPPDVAPPDLAPLPAIAGMLAGDQGRGGGSVDTEPSALPPRCTDTPSQRKPPP